MHAYAEDQGRSLLYQSAKCIVVIMQYKFVMVSEMESLCMCTAHACTEYSCITAVFAHIC